jgi:hypothetical protein
MHLERLRVNFFVILYTTLNLETSFFFAVKITAHHIPIDNGS